MSIDNAKAILINMQAEIQQALNELTIVKVNVNPGDNLPSLIEQAAASTIFVVNPLYSVDVDLYLNKPVSLITSILGQTPTINGTVTCNTPSVSICGFKIQGTIKENTILVMGPGTKIDSCSLIGSSLGQHRGIEANSTDGVITNSSIMNIFADIDAQAIAGWNGTKRLTVINTQLEASGENIIFGGADPTSVDNIPQDITLTNLTMSKNPTWKGNAAITVKNLIEIKNAQRLTFTDSVCNYSWLSGQDGYGLVLTVRDQSGTAPYSIIEDVLIQNVTFNHLGAGINVLGSDDTFPSQRMTNVKIQGCKFYDINPLLWGGSGRQVMIARGPLNLSLINNDFEGASLNSAITFAGTPLPLCDGLTITGNRFQEGDYGIIGDSAPSLGKAAWLMYSGLNSTWSNNTIVKGTSGRTIVYPDGTIMA